MFDGLSLLIPLLRSGQGTVREFGRTRVRGCGSSAGKESETKDGEGEKERVSGR
jgi:hypothetical protein